MSLHFKVLGAPFWPQNRFDRERDNEDCRAIARNDNHL